VIKEGKGLSKNKKYNLFALFAKQSTSDVLALFYSSSCFSFSFSSSSFSLTLTCYFG
jgi:hypothetical protein